MSYDRNVVFELFDKSYLFMLLQIPAL